MRVCKECGHVDPNWWRPAAFHQHIDYAYLDGLDVLDPELYDLIKDKKPGETIIRGPFVYWLSSRSPTVRRAWIEDFKVYGKSVPQERVSHSPQTTLDDSKLVDDSINLLYVNHPKLDRKSEEKE